MSNITLATTALNTVSLPDGTDVFYRSQGSPNNPVVLLLHGFPSSSFQYRNLIPILALQGYYAIAPDFPGFGFTTYPETYNHTFDNLSKTLELFIEKLNINCFTAYIFDYGAPTLLRLALRRPELISAILTQNGNAYVEGIDNDFWKSIKKYWETGSVVDRQAVRDLVLTYNATKSQYVDGTPERDLKNIDPSTYTLDFALLQRPGNTDYQLDLFYDYRTNVELYPEFQKYFRQSRVPILGVWGKNDAAFPPAGLAPYKRDSPDAELHLLDGGHFLIESDLKQVVRFVLDFLKRQSGGRA